MYYSTFSSLSKIERQMLDMPSCVNDSVNYSLLNLILILLYVVDLPVLDQYYSMKDEQLVTILEELKQVFFMKLFLVDKN